MDISEVAKRSGVAASALRYYERKGLIRSVAPEGTRRRFAPGVLDTLALIALGQAAGFSLDEIRAMFTPGGTARIDRSQLTAKAGNVDMDKAERDVRRKEGIIQSMTPLERRKPELIKATRKRRIAAGAGVQVQEVNRLLNEFEQMQGMMKKMKGVGMMKMIKRMGGMKGMPKMPF